MATEGSLASPTPAAAAAPARRFRRRLPFLVCVAVLAGLAVCVVLVVSAYLICGSGSGGGGGGSVSVAGIATILSTRCGSISSGGKQAGASQAAPSGDAAAAAAAASSGSGSGPPRDPAPAHGRPTCTFSDVVRARVRRTKVTPQDLADLAAVSPSLAALASSSSRFSRSADAARLRQLMRLVNYYFAPWLPDPSAAGRNASTWTVSHVRDAATATALLACCIHVRCVDGRIFFRYGGRVPRVPWLLTRANAFIALLHHAVRTHSLRLRVEFLYSACAGPVSPGSAAAVPSAGGRANYLVLSNHLADGFTDVLVPDVLAASHVPAAGPAGAVVHYMPSEAELAAARRVRWRDRVAKLVFRGATTNFALRFGNWGSSPRVRLHRMSDGVPGGDLDARLSRWSHTTPGAVWAIRRRDGLDLAPVLDFAAKNGFKYEAEVDGAIGSTRTCGVLAGGGRVLVRQASPWYAFFDPLMRRGRHFLEVRHSLQDLPDTVAYMQQHDGEMEAMAARAQREVAWVCEAPARALGLALVLAKYQAVQGEAELVRPPPDDRVCAWGARTRVAKPGDPDWYDTDDRPECMHDGKKPRVAPVPGCPAVCTYLGLVPDDWYWVTSDQLLAAMAEAGAAGGGSGGQRNGSAAPAPS